MCGIIGISYKNFPAAQDAYIGLMNLQHRGKETAGMAVYNQGRTKIKKGEGEVALVLSKKYLSQLDGTVAIGQTRYTTTGSSYDERNTQPIVNTFRGEEFFIGHNGNIVNINQKNSCELNGVSDTYLVGEMINQSTQKKFEEAVIEVLRQLQGSFNFIFLFRGVIYVAMDRFGFHPLVLGQKNDGYVVASETSAIKQIGADYLKEVEPGDFLVISQDGLEKSKWTTKDIDLKFDLFEFIYFSRPDSRIYGTEVGLARRYMGRNLAIKFPIKADLVIPAPDSANDIALGYYNQIKSVYNTVNFEPWALFRSHFVGRTFIEPIINNRELANQQKFNPRADIIGDKSVILVDDSIVRSNTAKSICRQLKTAGAKEIYLLSAAPKYLFPDIYGVDTYRNGEKLIMKEYNGDEDRLAQELDIEMVAYLDLNSTIDSVLQAQACFAKNKIFNENSFYTGPFTGGYPDGIGCYELN